MLRISQLRNAATVPVACVKDTKQKEKPPSPAVSLAPCGQTASLEKKERRVNAATARRNQRTDLGRPDIDTPFARRAHQSRQHDEPKPTSDTNPHTVFPPCDISTRVRAVSEGNCLGSQDIALIALMPRDGCSLYRIGMRAIWESRNTSRPEPTPLTKTIMQTPRRNFSSLELGRHRRGSGQSPE
jgi:hypothetical protein